MSEAIAVLEPRDVLLRKAKRSVDALWEPEQRKHIPSQLYDRFEELNELMQQIEVSK